MSMVIFTNSGKYASTGVSRTNTEDLYGSVSRTKKPILEAEREAYDKGSRYEVTLEEDRDLSVEHS